MCVLSSWPVPLFLVGGAVRDSLLGLPVKDRDVCSSLLPHQVVEWCNVFGIKCELTNEAHLVVTLWIEGEAIEHTTFRREFSCDGVHAQVEPSTLHQDLHRRDLTINGLAIEWGSNEVVDLVGGLSDLENKVLRLISSETYGSEFDRLWEHGGRLFRLARFASSKFSGWSIHPDTLAACRRFSPLVFSEGRGKWESFGEEWSKANFCWEYLQVLDTFGFLQAHGLVLPEASSWSSNHPWFSLWVSSGKPDLRIFQNQWKLSKEVVLSIQDLEVGASIEHEWQWRTSKFRRLQAKEVASFWGQSFRELHIPTQGEVAQEVGSGPHVVPTWVERVKEVYK